MTETKKMLGVFTLRTALSEVEQALVGMAISATNSSYCYQSDFPVGCALLAANEEAVSRVFHGCNVENIFFPATICAERNAVTTAVMEGFRKLQIVAVFCRKYPGGAPCGVCRQVLTEFGRGATLLNIVDHQGNVRRCMVDELLPAATGELVQHSQQTATERRLVAAALRARSKSHVPYSKYARGAVLVGSNASGKLRSFAGAEIDNASYGASVGCENVAMIAARMHGFVNDRTLVVTIEEGRSLTGHNPIDGECLQILREFGGEANIILTAADKSLVRTTLGELLPESFGPHSL